MCIAKGIQLFPILVINYPYQLHSPQLIAAYMCEEQQLLFPVGLYVSQIPLNQWYNTSGRFY